MSESLTVGGVPVEIVNGRARRFIRFELGETIIVTKPRWVSRRQAFEALEQAWPRLRRRLERVPSDVTLVPAAFEDGARLRCLGRVYEMRFVSGRRVRTEGEVLLVPDGTEEQRRARVRRWMRSCVGGHCLALADAYAGQLGVAFERLSVRDFRSQFGSCVNRSRLQFHWGIGLLPLDHLASIVAHEVAHLKHPGHGREFWDTVESLKPGARRLHREFRSVGRRLRF